jgi:ribonuclease P protein component
LKNDQPDFRVGLSVSKKVGNAVTRNRIKRYIRQTFLEIKDEVLPNADYVIIARQQAANLDFHESKKSLEHVLKIARALPRK